MSALSALFIIASVVLAAALVGVLCIRMQGRVRSVRGEKAIAITADSLGLDTDEHFGEQATLVQFSTQFCSKCPATARLLQNEASELAGVNHIEIDLTDALEIAQRFNVLQTPTVLVLDHAGRLRARITGSPTSGALRDELSKIGALPYEIRRTELAS